MRAVLQAWADSASVVRIDRDDTGGVTGLAAMDSSERIAVVRIPSTANEASDPSEYHGEVPTEGGGVELINIKIGPDGSHRDVTKLDANNQETGGSTTDVQRLGDSIVTDHSERGASTERVLHKEESPNGSSTTHTFEQADGTTTSTTTTTDEHGDSVSKSVTRTPNGSTESTTKSDMNGNFSQSSTTYDGAGHVVAHSTSSHETTPTGSIDSEAIVQPDGSSTTTTRQTDGSRTTTTIIERDPQGRETSHTIKSVDGGKITETIKNGDGTTTVITTGGTGSGVTTVTETIDANGNPTGDMRTVTESFDPATGGWKVVDQVDHPDGSVTVTTKFLDSNGQVVEETTEEKPPPDEEEGDGDDGDGDEEDGEADDGEGAPTGADGTNADEGEADESARRPPTGSMGPTIGTLEQIFEGRHAKGGGDDWGEGPAGNPTEFRKFLGSLIAEIAASAETGWGDSSGDEGPRAPPRLDIEIDVPTATDDWGDLNNPRALIASLQEAAAQARLA